MSGVLQRLVARATGAETPGLQARLPARFEAGAMMEDGFSERVQEVAAEPPRTPDEPAPIPARTVTPRDTVGARRAEPAEPRIPAEIPQPEAPNGHTKGAREVGPIAGTPPVERHHDAERATAPPAPLLTATERVLERVVSTEQIKATRSPAPQRHPEAAPPEPLLPLEPPKTNATPLPDAPIPARRDERGPPTGDAPAASPPEISIHIGRIEVRGEPAKAAPPKRAPRELKLTSLADFLDGGAT